MASPVADEFDDDCEFWLPPQFLADDDFKNGIGEENAGRNTGLRFRPRCLFGSDLGSPVESPPETESDEEEYIFGLTRKMAYATLEDDATKDLGLSRSPQSTLWGNQIPSRGSTNCSSRASSPPPAPDMTGKEDGGAWDLLRAAAGDVARMKMMEESAAAAAFGGIYPIENEIWAPPRKPSPVAGNAPEYYNPATANPGLMGSSFYQPPHLPSFQDYTKLAQFQRLTPEQMGNQSGNGRAGSIPAMNSPRPNMSSWPSLQQSVHQPRRGSGMRAVFIGNPGGTKRESAGTGVFLPRTGGAAADSRKKSVCSTVLLPEKVVQALNLNFESLPHQPQIHHPRFTYDHHVGTGVKIQRNNERVWLQERPKTSASTVSQELLLPQEWTY
ncbi:unnamed protein product [Cuscuta campestris]|uniref:Uncharacterized protein n=1 Tax=Cuscuta campestris TaxID=132261 RepID=A0A484N4Y9_9ASTE|nr:unnamed protein product [Cuscuta campestris]